MDVDGAPSVKLAIGDDEREAEYQTGTGTTILVFEYEVQIGDKDTDGITVSENGLVLNDGSIADEADVEANLSIATATVNDQFVDAKAPEFESAETSEDGEIVTITITITEDVDVASQLRTLTTFAGVDVGVYLQVLVDVFADGHRMYATGAEMSGTDLTVTMDEAITQGQAVTVAYDNIFAKDQPGILVDVAGNAVEQFSSQIVTNNSSVADNDEAIWPVLSSHSLTVAEGLSDTYTVALDSQPDSDVTVSLTVVPGSHITADVSDLTFTTENWETAQTVTLTASSVDDEQNFWQEIIHTSETEGFVAGHVKVLVERQ